MWQSAQQVIALGDATHIGPNKFKFKNTYPLFHLYDFAQRFGGDEMRAAWSRDHPTRSRPEKPSGQRGAEADYFDRWLAAYEFSQA